MVPFHCNLLRVSKGRSPGSSIVMWDHVREKVLAESNLKPSPKFLSSRETTAMQIYSSQKHKCLKQPHCEAVFYYQLWKIISFFPDFFFFVSLIAQTKHQKGEGNDPNAVHAIRWHYCVSCPIDVGVIDNSVISKQFEPDSKACW